MAARSSIGTFSFPSAKGCLSPTGLADELGRLSRVTSVLGGALAMSLFGSLWLSYFAVKRADVLPYVADGGVFGCAVKAAEPPAEDGQADGQDNGQDNGQANGMAQP